MYPVSSKSSVQDALPNQTNVTRGETHSTILRSCSYTLDLLVRSVAIMRTVSSYMSGVRRADHTPSWNCDEQNKRGVTQRPTPQPLAVF